MSDPSNPQAPGEQPHNPYGQPPSPPQYAAQPPQPYGQPGYTPPGYAQTGYPAYQGDADRRPGTVTTAGVVTIVLSGLSLIFGLLLLAVGASGSETFSDGFRDGAGGSYDDFSDDEINNVLIGIGVGVAVWSVAAIVLAIFTMRRSNVARVLLVVSSAACVLVSLVGILSVVSIVTLIGAIAVIVLLFVGGANDWFARRAQPPVGAAQPWG